MSLNVEDEDPGAVRPEPDESEEWIREFADSLTDTERLVR